MENDINLSEAMYFLCGIMTSGMHSDSSSLTFSFAISHITYVLSTFNK